MTPPCSVLVVAVFAELVSTRREMPGQALSSDAFGPCAIAGAKFTAVSNATVAAASSSIFISVLRNNSADGGIAVVSRVGRLTAATLSGNLGRRRLTPRHNDVTLS